MKNKTAFVFTVMLAAAVSGCGGEVSDVPLSAEDVSAGTEIRTDITEASAKPFPPRSEKVCIKIP